MVLHNDPLLSIYFGDARSGLDRDFLMNDHSQNDLWRQEKLLSVKKLLRLTSLVLLKQIHSADGIAILDKEPLVKPEGDFLVTQKVLTGLGVYTADCLPIVFYDTVNRAVGICHAGWVGTVNGVAVCTLKRMQEEFGTDLDHVRIFFGPSAKLCCYVVGEDFKKNLEGSSLQDKVLVSKGDELFFDLPLCNKLQLVEYGVRRESFNEKYNGCTICNPSYCSSRRSKGSKERQLTIVTLK